MRTVSTASMMSLFGLEEARRTKLQHRVALDAVQLRLEEIFNLEKEAKSFSIQYEDGFIVFNATRLERLEELSGLDAQEIVKEANTLLHEKNQPFTLVLKKPLAVSGDNRLFMTVHLRSDLYRTSSR